MNPRKQQNTTVIQVFVGAEGFQISNRAVTLLRLIKAAIGC